MNRHLVAGVLLPLFLGVSGWTASAQAGKPEWVEQKQNGNGGEHKSGSSNGAQNGKGAAESKGSRDAKGSLQQEQRHSYRDDDKGKASRDERRDYDDRRLSNNDRDRLLRRVMSEHYGVEYLSDRHRYQSLPPGLRKKLQRGGDLPPGWRDKLVRGQVIDYDLYRQAEHLPSDLLNKLTGRQDGIELLRIGDRIVRVMEGRGTVLDVIDLSDRALGLFD